MSYSSIPDAWRDIGKAVKKDLVDLIHTNLEDLDGRVTNVEGSISTQIIANQLINKERDHAPIGSMVWSPLDSTTFAAAVNDGGWQLCDGSSVSGSDYATLMSRSTAPDLRGKFMRMRAHGTSTTYNADGDVATDTVQAHNIASHSHVMNHGHLNTFDVSGNALASAGHSHIISHVHKILDFDYHFTSAGSLMQAMTTASPSITDINGAVPTNAGIVWSTGDSTFGAAQGSYANSFTMSPTVDTVWYSAGVQSSYSGSGSTAKSNPPDSTDTPSLTGSVTSFSGSTSTTGSGDTRPHNVTEECFIKINKNYITTRTGYLLWRAPQALTINQVVLTPVTQGTSGTLTVDIKKGPLTSITTSIFTALPSMLYSDTTAQTGTINATNAVIAAGDYVRLDITVTQAKLQAFHILIAATPT